MRLPSRQLIIVLLLLAASGCASRERTSAEAIGCRTDDIKLVDSAYAREGSTTAWCARCNGQTYHCATNPDHSAVRCRPSTPDDGCR